MKDLNDLLNTDVKIFEQEIDTLDGVLSKVAPTFRFRQMTWCKGESCRKSKNQCEKRMGKACFVNEITPEGDKRSSLIGGWSTSINSMMLNLTMYLLHPEFKSSLIQGNRAQAIPEEVNRIVKEEKNFNWVDDSKEIFKLLRNCFSKEHNERRDPLNKGFHDSSIYGSNPWSTMAWFGEIILYKLSATPKAPRIRLTKCMIQWCKIVLERIQSSLYNTDLEKAFPAGIDGMRSVHCYKLLKRFIDSVEDINVENRFEQTIGDIEVKLWKIKILVKEKLRPMFLHRVFHHFTSFDISDGLFDPGEMTFSMEGLILLDSDRHFIRDVHLERFFDVIHQCLSRDVYWKVGKPMTINTDGATLIPLSAEVANSLLRICRQVSKDPQKLDWFRKYKKIFADYEKWVIAQMVTVHRRSTYPEAIVKTISDYKVKSKKKRLEDEINGILEATKISNNKVLKRSFSNKDDAYKKKIPVTLFPFFPEGLRKDLYFILNQKTNNNENKEQKIMNQMKKILKDHRNDVQLEDSIYFFML